MLAATGPFLTMHPRTLLRTPQMHPSLAAIVDDMRGTRNPISEVPVTQLRGPALHRNGLRYGKSGQALTEWSSYCEPGFSGAD